MSKKPTVLMILDGYGLNKTAEHNAVAAGKTPVTWNFSTIPSETWKNGVGSALLEYAQGTGDWAAVESAFVEGWATEYAATH